MKTRKIVESLTEPSTQDIWLHNGVLKIWGKNGWQEINTSSNSTPTTPSEPNEGDSNGGGLKTFEIDIDGEIYWNNNMGVLEFSNDNIPTNTDIIYLNNINIPLFNGIFVNTVLYKSVENEDSIVYANELFLDIPSVTIVLTIQPNTIMTLYALLNSNSAGNIYITQENYQDLLSNGELNIQDDSIAPSLHPSSISIIIEEIGMKIDLYKGFEDGNGYYMFSNNFAEPGGLTCISALIDNNNNIRIILNSLNIENSRYAALNNVDTITSPIKNNVEGNTDATVQALDSPTESENVSDIMQA